ncbi:MAG: S9 family peptidase [Erysipelotrichaceae bacterium]|nr:S9 family peptidase [Erysipelotrichaceae bacterium]
MKKIMIEDLYKFRFIENLSFDPSGKNYAYHLANVDKKKDSYFKTVYVNKKAYKSDKNTSILGWYDASRLIISEENKNKKALYNKYLLLDIKDGKRRNFFSTPLSVSSVKVVDENTLIFAAFIDANEPDVYKYSKEKLQKYKDGLKKEADYEVLDEIPYWMNGAGFTNKKRRALFLCHIKPFSIERISEPLFSLGSMELQGRTLYFAGSTYASKMPLYEKIYALDIDSKNISCLYDKEDYAVSSLFCFNDSLICMATDGKRYGLNETNRFYEVKENELKELAFFDRSFYDSAGADTSLGGGKNKVVRQDGIYTLVTEKDHVEIWKIDKKFKKQKLVAMPKINFFDVNEDKIVFCASNEKALPDLYAYSFKDKKVKKISSFNEAVLKGKYVAPVKEINYTSQDMELNGFVLLPKDYDKKKKYPAILDVHGGPRTVYSKAFFHEMQVWASEGYFVMFTNIRGSDGRGDAFADIRGKYGADDFVNLMDFVDEVLKNYPAIDEKRICETGGSYGGFMTNWIIGHTDRFCAAASQRSISNWLSFNYLSDIGFYFATDQNGTDDMIRDYQKLWDRSPLKYADNVKTPTLFIHSDQDYRCPLPEGMQMMQALAERGVDTRLVLFHGENHELSRSGKLSHRIRRLTEITAWFNKYANVI